MENIKEFNRNDRVKVNNVRGWEVSFHSDIARRDILIPANAQNYALLTVDMVEEEILKQDALFTGLDGLGDHAALQICDPEMYKFLFRCEDKTHHFTKDTIVELLKLSSKSKFKTFMEENIRLESEARMCLYYMNDFDWSEYVGWKHEILENHCKSILWR